MCLWAMCSSGGGKKGGGSAGARGKENQRYVLRGKSSRVGKNRGNKLGTEFISGNKT